MFLMINTTIFSLLKIKINLNAFFDTCVYIHHADRVANHRENIYTLHIIGISYKCFPLSYFEIYLYTNLLNYSQV